MEILIICMLTTLVDFFLSKKVDVDVYKAFADYGYVFNKSRLIDIFEEEMRDENIFDRLLYILTPYIPFYNLYDTICDWIKYTEYTEEFLDIFNRAFIIEKMTNSELEKYNKNKTGKCAMKIEKEMHKRRGDSFPVIYDDGSSIWYTEDDTAEEYLSSIKIVEARGKYEQLSDDELRKMVYDAQIAMVSATFESDDYIFDLPEDRFYEEHIDLSVDDLDKKNNVKKRIKKK